MYMYVLDFHFNFDNRICDAHSKRRMASTERHVTDEVRALPQLASARARARPFFGFRACDKVACTNTSNVRQHNNNQKNPDVIIIVRIMPLNDVLWARALPRRFD